MNIIHHPAPRSEWANRICAAWRQSVGSILETGRLLKQAKEALIAADWTAMIECELPFTRRTADRLIAIGEDPKLADPTHVSLLPPHWGTIYECIKLDDKQFEACIADGTINPDMERRDIATVVKRARREKREQELGGVQMALPEKKYGVILADPEWRFEPWSRTTGMDRAADNHYPTSCTEVIAARDVGSIVADDCVLFLWATVPMLPHALLVMGAWGFDYKSQCIWRKHRFGTGYWFLNQHEILMVGTRGKVPGPAPGTQWPSVIDAPVCAHSAKPEVVSEMIEQYFPTLPKIELNRRGPPRQGWDAWGFEVQEATA